MEFLDGSWKKEVSSWDALMGEELLNQEAILEGAIHSIRNMGDVAFVIIRRREGLFQTVFVNEDVDFSIHDLKEGMTVRVKGVVNKEERAPHGRELHIREIQVLPPPAPDQMDYGSDGCISSQPALLPHQNELPESWKHLEAQPSGSPVLLHNLLSKASLHTAKSQSP